MSVHTVKILMHMPTTYSQRWHSRRLNKMVRSVWHCFAYADPGQMVDVQFFVDVDTSNIPGIDTYTVELKVQLPNDKMETFIRYAKKVKIFHQISHRVELQSAPEHATIPA